MPELLKLTPPDESLRKLLSQLTGRLSKEKVRTEDALGRYIAEPVRAGESLPSFRKSTMDGYAVRAEDTFGAGESLPAYLKVTDEAKMGTDNLPKVGKGEAVLIHTGGMVPEGSDAVVMIEYTQEARVGEIEVLRPVGSGENIIQIGEDVREGEELFSPGHRIRTQDIGGLSALGFTELSVFVPPKVAIISTGDEVVDPGTIPGPGEVRDINSYTISGTVVQAGGVPLRLGNFPDEYDSILSAAKQALEEVDVLVISAGSSVSVRDMTADIIGELGSPGVLVHGVALKPGKPTILGVCDGKPVIGLPGNPVSALVTSWLFLTPVIHYLLQEESSGLNSVFAGTVDARLTKNIKSTPGKEEYAPVRLIPSGSGHGSPVVAERKASGENWKPLIEAEPIFGKSNLIYTMIHADGLVHIPINANGFPAGSDVKVFLFQ